MQPLSLGLRRDPIDHPRHEPSDQRPKAGGIGASDDDATPPAGVGGVPEVHRLVAVVIRVRRNGGEGQACGGRLLAQRPLRERSS
jgi:hypothetical protein